jgi:hypothetical protein
MPGETRKVAFKGLDQPLEQSVLGLILNGFRSRSYVAHDHSRTDRFGANSPVLTHDAKNYLHLQYHEALKCGGMAMANIFELSLENVDSVVNALAESGGQKRNGDPATYIANTLAIGIREAGQSDLAEAIIGKYASEAKAA